MVVTVSLVGMEGLMLSSIRRLNLCWEFRMSGCLFSIFGLKPPEKQKQDWKKTHLSLVTDRSDSDEVLRSVNLNSIMYITM